MAVAMSTLGSCFVQIAASRQAGQRCCRPAAPVGAPQPRPRRHLESLYPPLVAIEYPWPEAPERVNDRVRGMVESVVRADELVEVRLEWVTPLAHRFDRPGAGWIALRLTVLAKGDEGERFEFWSPDSGLDWEPALAQLANDLEDWVCETSFAWGQERRATVPQ